MFFLYLIFANLTTNINVTEKYLSQASLAESIIRTQNLVRSNVWKHSGFNTIHNNIWIRLRLFANFVKCNMVTIP